MKDSMLGCKRCPTCHSVPTFKLEASASRPGLEDAVLRCEQHGHVAQGDDLEMAVKHWNIYIDFVEANPAPSTDIKFNKLVLLLVAALLFPAVSQAAPSTVPNDMTAYTDNAILNAAEHGYSHIVLVFGRASADDVEAVAEDLRGRGYRLDEEARELAPGVIKVLGLRSRTVASARVR